MVKAGTEFGTTKLVLYCTIGNKINAINAANHIFTYLGIGYVESNGADAKSPDILVKIAMKRIILLIENNTSKLNTTLHLLIVELLT